MGISYIISFFIFLIEFLLFKCFYIIPNDNYDIFEIELKQGAKKTKKFAKSHNGSCYKLPLWFYLLSIICLLIPLLNIIFVFVLLLLSIMFLIEKFDDNSYSYTDKIVFVSCNKFMYLIYNIGTFLGKKF